MNFFKVSFMVVIISLLSLSGCEQGPMEEAGEKMDESMESVANQTEDACEEAKEGMELEDSDC